MKKTAFLLAACFAVLTGWAQSELSLEGAVLKGRNFYPKSTPQFQWIPGTDLYSFNADRYQSLVIEHVDGKNTYPTITAQQVNDRLGENYRSLPGLWMIKWHDDSTFYFQSENTLFTYDLSGNLEVVSTLDNEAENLNIDPKTLHAAYTVGNNVKVSWNDGSSTQVTSFEDENIVAGAAIARSEFGITNGLFWSPKGDAIAFYQKDESEVTDYPLLDITTTPGALNEVKYPMAGQGSEYAKVGVYHRGMDAPIYLDTDGAQRDQYLTNLSWSPDGSIITLAIINREQNHFDVVAFDAKTGAKIRTLFSEDDEQWAEPEHPAYWLDTKTFVWLSERDGFMNLYLYNSSGKLLRQLTKNDFVATGIVGRDEEGNVLFTATGADPREQHLFSVSTRGRQKQLTSGAGYHSLNVQDGGEWYFSSYQSVTVPRIETVANYKGTNSRILLNADDPFEGTNIRKPELGAIQGPDGSTLYTRLYKPYDFDPTKKYPVLVYVYGGPHAQMITNRWNAGGPLWMNEFANRGYLVFTLDNRGSAHRGTAFEQQIHRQLGTVEIEDQLAGVEFLKSLPFVDANRMAVHGWSYGGFMTTSLMLRSPGTFKAGIAGGPVTDWKYYEVMYGERYMDRPEENEEGYAANRLHNHVKNLEGELLLIHGTIDDVVVMQHNLSLVKAFIDEGIQMDFFPYPMHPHNVRGKDRLHLMTKVLDYVEEHLAE